MATQDDVRRIARSFPATTEGSDGFAFVVEGKAFVWAWQERVDPKRARVPSREVVAVRVGTEFEKESLIEMDPAVFFTEAHYDGYPSTRWASSRPVFAISSRASAARLVPS